ncbi:MAG: hypothetical protein PHD51_02365 [Patescibacteria group bacterium]|nr:hypothetical protein [Patescibacteria group bacterium]MDD5490295.1 hypothetical protein [Patescibacteria group bacterium]
MSGRYKTVEEIKKEIRKRSGGKVGPEAEKFLEQRGTVPHFHSSFNYTEEEF